MSPHDETEADLVATGVDRHPTGPTEDDEEQVLHGLYGGPDAEGVYRGEAS
jgi:hypothetical protein